MVAIEQASIIKKCGIQFQGKPPGATLATVTFIWWIQSYRLWKAARREGNFTLV